jgi:hypothetical protein
MNTPSPAPSGRSLPLLIVAALALTAICALLVLLGTRTAQRIDVTRTRAHALAPRTQQVLARLDRPATFAVAAELDKLTPAVRQSLLDVLEKFERSSPRTAQGKPALSVRLINTSSQSGIADFDALLADLASREQGLVQARTASLLALVDQAATLTAPVAQVAASMDGARDAVLESLNKNAQARWDALAAALRASVQDVDRAGARTRELLAQPAAPLPVPPIDQAKLTLGAPVEALASSVTRLTTELEALLKAPGVPDSLKARLTPLAGPTGSLPPIRERAAKLSADISALTPPRILTIARALERTQAALLIADPASPQDPLNIVGIEPAALLDAPPADAQGAAPDPRARIEDVLAGAVSNLASPIRPVVVFVHEYSDRLASRNWPTLAASVKRLSARGIDSDEWPVALERDLPARLARHDPLRPAVFIPVPGLVDTRQQRVSTVAQYLGAIDTLVKSGRPILMGVELSQIPSSGAPDPQVEALKALGIVCDSGRMLLEESKLGNRRVVAPTIDLVLDPALAETHPIAGTLVGLRTRLASVSTIAVQPGTDTIVTPLLAVPATPARWLESEWGEYRAAVMQLRGEYQRIANAPSKDTSADGQLTAGTYTLALAAQRPLPDTDRPQRVIVVGSSGWYADAVVNMQAEVDGRTVALFPGNLQLLESSVTWLAGLDDQLLRSAATSVTATIPALGDGQVTAMRWALAGGLPVLILLTGLVVLARQNR